MTFYKPLVSGAFTADTMPREPADHVCGKCRTPWGLTNPECPNRPAASTPHINILAAPLDAMFTDEEAAAVLTEWMNE